MYKTILFSVSLLFALPSFGQDVWNDYVIGRPMAGYFDAKKAVAKAWGINYKTIFAGCIISDEINDEAQKYKIQNEAYFKQLETSLGKDWMNQFNLEVKKEQFKAIEHTPSDVWIDPVVGKPQMNHFEAKKAVAKRWGIKYRSKFLGCVVSDDVYQSAQQAMEASSNYQRRLGNHFGDGWQKIFSQEVAAEKAKLNMPPQLIEKPPSTSSDIWIDYLDQKAILYNQAKMTVAKAWKIAYHQRFSPTNGSKSKLEKEYVDKNNALYFVALAKDFGDDWKLRFNIDVQKELVKLKSNKE